MSLAWVCRACPVMQDRPESRSSPVYNSVLGGHLWSSQAGLASCRSLWWGGRSPCCSPERPDQLPASPCCAEQQHWAGWLSSGLDCVCQRSRSRLQVCPAGQSSAIQSSQSSEQHGLSLSPPPPPHYSAGGLPGYWSQGWVWQGGRGCGWWWERRERRGIVQSLQSGTLQEGDIYLSLLCNKPDVSSKGFILGTISRFSKDFHKHTPE